MNKNTKVTELITLTSGEFTFKGRTPGTYAIVSNLNSDKNTRVSLKCSGITICTGVNRGLDHCFVVSKEDIDAETVYEIVHQIGPKEYERGIEVYSTVKITKVSDNDSIYTP